MNLLLDTHTILWWVNEYEKLSHEAKSMLLNETHALYISIVSTWEIAIKVSLGRMTELHGGVKTFFAKVESMPVYILPITPQHIEIVETLPVIHRDPFDRLLVSTAKADNLTILTADENIHKYDVPVVW
jgi:PIN domain nuclease of toxin-antitoxin system